MTELAEIKLNELKEIFMFAASTAQNRVPGAMLLLQTSTNANWVNSEYLTLLSAIELSVTHFK